MSVRPTAGAYRRLRFGGAALGLMLLGFSPASRAGFPNRDCGCDSGPAPVVVATVNGNPVTVEELQMSMRHERAAVYQYFHTRFHLEDGPRFWTTACDGETPRARLLKAAMDESVAFKVKQQLLHEAGLSTLITYASWHLDWQAELVRRAQPGQRVYGPRRIAESSYFQERMNTGEAALLHQFESLRFSANPGQLRACYETEKTSHFKRGVSTHGQSFSLPANAGQARVRLEALRNVVAAGTPIDAKGLADSGVKEEPFDFNDENAHVSALLPDERAVVAARVPPGQVSELFTDGSRLMFERVISREAESFVPYEKAGPEVRALLLRAQYRAWVQAAVSSAALALRPDQLDRVDPANLPAEPL